MELFNPHDNQWLIDKFAHYRTLRDLEQAYYSEEYKMYIITRYDDVAHALSDPKTFSSGHGNLVVEKSERFGKTLGASDDPIHALYKNIIKQGYSKSNIDRICDLYTDKINQFIDRCYDVIDISELAEDTTAWAIAELINLPHDKQQIRDLIFEIQRKAEHCVRYDIDHRAYDQFTNLCYEYTKNKKPSDGPGLYKEYIANVPGHLQILSLLVGPTLSGASSLTGAVEFMLLDLFRQHQVDSIMGNPILIPKAVNESMRFNATTGRFSRTVQKTVRLHGVELKRGDRIVASLESANRDPRKIENPDVFDLNRDTSGHLAFGYGVHACIALTITRSLMCVFLENFIKRIGHYRITTETKDLQYYITASGNNDMLTNLTAVKIDK